MGDGSNVEDDESNVEDGADASAMDPVKFCIAERDNQTSAESEYATPDESPPPIRPQHHPSGVRQSDWRNTSGSTDEPRLRRSTRRRVGKRVLTYD